MGNHCCECMNRDKGEITIIKYGDFKKLESGDKDIDEINCEKENAERINTSQREENNPNNEDDK